MASEILKTCLQAAVLQTINAVLSGYLMDKAFAEIKSLGIPGVDPPAHLNGTDDLLGPAPTSTIVDWSLLPIALRYIALQPALYYWNIWLERMLPTRPRGQLSVQARRGGAFAAEEDLVKAEGSESVEEEAIMRRWIAQGKVRRSSINWCNTALKWLIELSIGNLLSAALQAAMDSLLARRIDWSDLSITVAQISFGRFFSLWPWTRLLSFIVIPAHKRIIFDAGAELVWTAFFTQFLRVVVTWVAHAEWFQEALRNATEAANNTSHAGVTLGDEL